MRLRDKICSVQWLAFYWDSKCVSIIPLQVTPIFWTRHARSCQCPQPLRTGKEIIVNQTNSPPVLQQTSSTCKPHHLQKHFSRKKLLQSTTAGYLITLGLRAGWVIYGRKQMLRERDFTSFSRIRGIKVFLLTLRKWMGFDQLWDKDIAACKWPWNWTMMSAI